MRFGLVINPVSGRGGRRPNEASRRVALAKGLAASAGCDVEIAVTTGPGQAAGLARELAGTVDVVMAWGGDGTVNEVAGALIGTKIALGIVPSGSGDGLARSLGLPLDVAQAFSVAIQGSSRAIDVAYLAGRHFLNVAGIGFDAVVGRAFNTRRRGGAFGYAELGFRTVWSYRPVHYRLQLEREVDEGRRFLVAFGNGRQYGNGLLLAPDADLEDGWLEVVIVDDGSPLRQLWRARRLAFGPRRPAQGVRRLRVRDASVTGDTLICHVDGETFEEYGTVGVAVRPKALWVRKPS